ncbi:hypothetical protein [Pleomorphomonas sp. PLEO]|uniref:hypothetical protein n=1 Tax=Pleomorphomonas sp. PLEO TaxID=3239306 RepID=UPI00351F5DF2
MSTTTLADLKAGDVVSADGGFDCLAEGPHVVEKDDHGLFIKCREGNHYLDGQEDDDGNLVGISKQ